MNKETLPKHNTDYVIRTLPGKIIMGYVSSDTTLNNIRKPGYVAVVILKSPPEEETDKLVMNVRSVMDVTDENFFNSLVTDMVEDSLMQLTGFGKFISQEVDIVKYTDETGNETLLLLDISNVDVYITDTNVTKCDYNRLEAVLTYLLKTRENNEVVLTYNEIRYVFGYPNETEVSKAINDMFENDGVVITVNTLEKALTIHLDKPRINKNMFKRNSPLEYDGRHCRNHFRR